MGERSRHIFLICVQLSLAYVSSFALPLQSIITKLEPITAKRHTADQIFTQDDIFDNCNIHVPQSVSVEPNIHANANFNSIVIAHSFENKVNDNAVVDLLPYQGERWLVSNDGAFCDIDALNLNHSRNLKATPILNTNFLPIEGKAWNDDNYAEHFYDFDTFFPGKTKSEPLAVNSQTLRPVTDVTHAQYQCLPSSIECLPITNQVHSIFNQFESAKYGLAASNPVPESLQTSTFSNNPFCNSQQSELNVISNFNAQVETPNYLSAFPPHHSCWPTKTVLESTLTPNFRDFSNNQFEIPLEPYQFYPVDNVNLKRECHDLFLASVDPSSYQRYDCQPYISSPTILNNPCLCSPIDAIQSAISYLDCINTPTVEDAHGLKLPVTSSCTFTSNVPDVGSIHSISTLAQPSRSSTPISLPPLSVAPSLFTSSLEYNTYPVPPLTLSDPLAKYFEEARTVWGMLGEFISNFNNRASLGNPARCPRLCEHFDPISVSPFELPSVVDSLSDTLKPSDNLFLPKVPLQNNCPVYREQLCEPFDNNFIFPLDSDCSAFTPSPYDLIPTNPSLGNPAPVVPIMKFIALETENSMLLSEILSRISVKGCPSSCEYLRKPIPLSSPAPISVPVDSSSPINSSCSSPSSLNEDNCESCHEEIKRLLNLIEMQLTSNRIS